MSRVCFKIGNLKPGFCILESWISHSHTGILELRNCQVQNASDVRASTMETDDLSSINRHDIMDRI